MADSRRSNEGRLAVLTQSSACVSHEVIYPCCFDRREYTFVMSKCKGRLLNYFCAIVMGTLLGRAKILPLEITPHAILAP
jgi:hypothetical protein